jgi:hypothetical protein
MKRLEIQRANGNMMRPLAGEDHISGIIFYLAALDASVSFTQGALSSIESAEAAGITADAETWGIRLVHHQLAQILRVNPGVSLYVRIAAKPEGANTFSEIASLQNLAGGRIRQIAVYDGGTPLAAASVTAMVGVLAAMEGTTPCSVLYAPKVASVNALPTNLAALGNERVSVVVSQDTEGVAAQLFSDEARPVGWTVSDIGIALGLVSKASVQESIGWVAKFPTGIGAPGFGDGTPLVSLDRAIIEELDTARYLFMINEPGLAGSYMNDSHNLDAATSDFAYIENVRTMDKACRGIRTYLLPELGGNAYVDPDTGKLTTPTINHLTDVANNQLENMEKAGEISGYRVVIDPDQNVLVTSDIAISIVKIDVGVIRRITVKIGNAARV